MLRMKESMKKNEKKLTSNKFLGLYCSKHFQSIMFLNCPFSVKDIPLVEFMDLVLTCMPGESCCR